MKRNRTDLDLLGRTQSEIVIHERADREDVIRVDARADQLDADLVVRLDHDTLIMGLVTRRIRIRLEVHVRGNAMAAGRRARR